MRIDSPKVSNLTFQTGSGVADSSFTGSFSGSFTGVGNFTGLTADSVEYANILNRPSGLVSGSSSQARAQIGLVIGTDVQAFQQNLTDISNLNPADGTFIVGAGSSFVAESGATARASLGLGSLAVLNTDSALGSIDLSGNSSYSFANLTNIPALVSGSQGDVLTFLGVESGATADQTASEIRSLVESATDSNVFTDADHTKLNNIEANADVTDTTNVVAALTAGTNVTIAADGTISSTDTNTTYSVGDGGLTQNNFTDALKSKLENIEANADVTDTTNVVAALTAGTNVTIGADGTISSTNTNTQLSEEQVEDIVGGMVTGNTETGITVTYQDADGTLDFVVATQSDENFTSALKSKLEGIAAGAEVNVGTDITVSESTSTVSIQSSTGNNDSIAAATTSAAGVMSSSDKTKLDGIEANADVTDTANVTAAGALMDSEVDADLKTFSLPANTTISAFGKTLVDDADASAARTTLGVDAAGTDNSTDVTLAGSYDYITISGQTITRNQINLATDVTGTLPVGNMSATALTTVQTASGQAAMLALTTQEGDVVVRTDENKTYMHNGGTAGTMADFTELATPTDSVTSVNGNTGAVTVTENVTTNLSTTANGTSLVINSSDGTNASIPAATTSAWGAMTDEDKTKLDGIETSADVTDTTNVVAALTAGTNITIAADGTISSTDTDTVYTHPTHPGDDFSVDTGTLTGATVVSDIDINVTTDTLGHVTDANGTVSTRTLTLADLGYTGATNANAYTHPSYNGDDISIDTTALTGATVISDLDFNITTDTSGHVVDANGTVATRDLTLGDLGFTGATNANYITNNNQLTNGAGYTTYTSNQATNTTSTPAFRSINLAGVTNPEITFNGSSDSGVDMAIKATPEGLDFYEPEDSNKVHFQILDDSGVNAAFGLQVGGTSVISSGRVLQNVTGNISQFTNDSGYITSYVNTTYSAGAGLDLSGTTFSIEPDLRDSITHIGYDSNDYIQWSNNAWTRTVVNGTERLRVDTSGIDVSGRIVADGDITAYSDERLKKDVETIDGALAKTVSLRGVEYTRIADDTRSIGVIAQEVEQVLPELVLTDDEGYKSVNYAQLTGVLIEAVKELAARVNELEANQ